MVILGGQDEGLPSILWTLSFSFWKSHGIQSSVTWNKELLVLSSGLSVLDISIIQAAVLQMRCRAEQVCPSLPGCCWEAVAFPSLHN